MTKKKIAHTKKSTKRPARNREEQPLPAGLIERAAARAGVGPSPTQKERPLDIHAPERIAERLQAEGLTPETIRFVLEAQSHNFREAANGIAPTAPGPDPYEHAIRHVLGRFASSLVKACDALGAEVVEIRQSGGGDDHNVVEALRMLWELRWELGITDSDVVIDAKASELAVEHATQRIHEALSEAAKTVKVAS